MLSAELLSLSEPSPGGQRTGHMLCLPRAAATRSSYPCLCSCLSPSFGERGRGLGGRRARFASSGSTHGEGVSFFLVSRRCLRCLRYSASGSIYARGTFLEGSEICRY